MKKKLKNIKIGDKIFGTDNLWHTVIDITPIHEPDNMFKIIFSNGSVKCSDTHQWSYWYNDVCVTTETLDIYINKDFFIKNNCRFGKIEDDVTLVDILKIKKEEVMCIVTDTEDGLFKIYTDKDNPIFTHNCGFRMFCGRATEAGASMVALDNTLATTVDNSSPGAGIVQAAGNPAFVRYYFSKFSDLEEYYNTRGLDSLGYDPNASTEAIEENISLEGDIELESSNDKTVFDFESEHKEIDHRQEQNWEEV